MTGKSADRNRKTAGKIGDTLYERCGGEPTVRRIVADFYRRMLATPSLRRYFENTDLEALADHQTKFVSWVMEGPVYFSDDRLRAAHLHLGITHDEFAQTVEHMRVALAAGGLAPADVDHVARALLRREPLIVAEDETGDGDPPTGTR